MKPLASWVCKPVRRTGSRAPLENKKNLIGSALMALDAKLVLKETANGLRSGSFAPNSETSNSYCSLRGSVSRTFESFFCAKRMIIGGGKGIE